MPGDWTHSDDLALLLVNTLRTHSWLFVKANSRKGAVVPEPRAIRRPDPDGDKDRKRTMTPEEFAAALRGKGLVRYTPKGE